MRPKGAASGPPSLGRKRLESSIESKFQAKAKSLGFITYKFTSPSKRSVPDRIVICPDVAEAKVGWLELKRWKEKPTPSQEREMRILRKAGCLVAWADNYEDAIYFLEVLRSS